MFSIFKKILNHLMIKDMTKDSQSKFQLLQHQTSPLISNVQSSLQCFAYILEKMDFDWGAENITTRRRRNSLNQMIAEENLSSITDRMKIIQF